MGRCDVCFEKNTAGCACTRKEEHEWETGNALQELPDKLDEMNEKLDKLIELLESKLA